LFLAVACPQRIRCAFLGTASQLFSSFAGSTPSSLQQCQKVVIIIIILVIVSNIDIGGFKTSFIILGLNFFQIRPPQLPQRISWLASGVYLLHLQNAAHLSESLFLDASWQRAPIVFCEWVFFTLVFRKCLAHSEGSEMKALEQDSRIWYDKWNRATRCVSRSKKLMKVTKGFTVFIASTENERWIDDCKIMFA
jgi:hypothetical protein